MESAVHSLLGLRRFRLRLKLHGMCVALSSVVISLLLADVMLLRTISRYLTRSGAQRSYSNSSVSWKKCATRSPKERTNEPAYAALSRQLTVQQKTHITVYIRPQPSSSNNLKRVLFFRWLEMTQLIVALDYVCRHTTYAAQRLGNIAIKRTPLTFLLPKPSDLYQFQVEV